MSFRHGFQPLSISMPENVSIETLPLLSDISKVLENKVSYWTGSSYPVSLPSTRFPSDTPSLVEVFQQFDPHEEDLNALSRNDRGEPRRLDTNQLEQLAQGGHFEVPSKFHSHSHKWKVARWLQKGKSPIQKTFQKGLGLGLYHVLFGIPDRLIRDASWSVRRGLSNLVTFGRRLVGLSVGWTEMVPKYSAVELDELILALENDRVKQQLEQEESSYDTRIFDNKLHEQYDPITETYRYKGCINFEDKRSVEWIQARKEVELLACEDESEREMRLVRLMNRRALSEVTKLLLAEHSLPRGYGKLWVDREHLNLIISEVEEDMQRDADQKREAVRRQVIEKHAILSGVPEWLDKKIEQHIDEECNNENYKMGWYRKVSIMAQAEGLGPLGAIYSDKILPFRMRDAQDLRLKMERELKPARVFSVCRKIWRSKKWIKIERNVAGATTYVPQMYMVTKIATDAKFWRLALIIQQSRARLSNGLCEIFQNLWNGPLGLKSLFLCDPFVSRFEINLSTGQLVPDRKNLTQTLTSRLTAIGHHVRKLRQDFEALPDTGFLGKPLARVLNILTAHLGIGVPGFLVVSLGQPLLTMIHVAVAIGLAVLSPVWAPLSSLAEHFFSIVVYDVHDPHGDGQWFPLVRLVAWDLAIAGVAQTALALAMGLVIHPSLATLRFTFETLRRQIRMGYDWFMRRVLLRLGRVPAQDSFLAWRVAGPGITARYCFQIRPEVAILVLWAKLEEKELDLFELDTVDKIKEPLTKYSDFFKDFEVFGLQVSDSHSSDGVLWRLRKTVHKQLADLSKRLSTRRLFNRALTTFEDRNGSNRTSLVEPGGTLRWIKQSEQDLELTIRRGDEVAAMFCEYLETVYTERSMSSLWYDTHLLPGDFRGLVRSLLTDAFGETFWTPLEASDSTIVIPVQPKTLESLVHELAV